MATYQYNVRVSLNDDALKGHPLNEMFINGQEAILKSRIFIKYEDCALAAKNLLTELTGQINELNETTKFQMGWESNPAIAHLADTEKAIEDVPKQVGNWKREELIKFHVFDINDAQQASKKVVKSIAKATVVIQKRPGLPVFAGIA